MRGAESRTLLVTSDECDFLYKCTEIYAPEHERTVLWNDPAIGVDWPVKDPLVSKKDEAGLPLAQHTNLMAYEPR
jgi:dTDP-4-dehydrorhamnose 3,5-epimerase